MWLGANVRLSFRNCFRASIEFSASLILGLCVSVFTLLELDSSRSGGCQFSAGN